jgi:hypothetical protein
MQQNDVSHFCWSGGIRNRVGRRTIKLLNYAHRSVAVYFFKFQSSSATTPVRYRYVGHLKIDRLYPKAEFSVAANVHINPNSTSRPCKTSILCTKHSFGAFKGPDNGLTFIGLLIKSADEKA